MSDEQSVRNGSLTACKAATLTDEERDAMVELCCTGEQSPFPRDWRAAAKVRKFLERIA